MDKQKLIDLATEFMKNSDDNQIKAESGLSMDLMGIPIFDAPVLGFSDAGDAFFGRLKEPGVIGSHFRLPGEWLSSGKTVISFFLPFSEAVKKSNALEKIWPSWEWLYSRVEGQRLLNDLGLYMQKNLAEAGYCTIIPTLDGHFFSRTAVKADLPGREDLQELSFTSNWSERHVAYVCGLGSFGLSRGLITKKGVAGRFGSLVTELELAPDERAYPIFNPYCEKCGGCAAQCPVHAISVETGKNHPKCSAFLDKTAKKFKPRYGCGKCQVGVPCASEMPQFPY